MYEGEWTIVPLWKSRGEQSWKRAVAMGLHSERERRSRRCKSNEEAVPMHSPDLNLGKFGKFRTYGFGIRTNPMTQVTSTGVTEHCEGCLTRLGVYRRWTFVCTIGNRLRDSWFNVSSMLPDSN